MQAPLATETTAHSAHPAAAQDRFAAHTCRVRKFYHPPLKMKSRFFFSRLQAALIGLLCLHDHTLYAAFPDPFDTEKTVGGPMPAIEAARSMKLPDGFRCQVFAAEPDVKQPIAMSWDARGRLWVAECNTYAETPLRWETKLRDRILIFEGERSDGGFNKRTVFWEQGTRLTGIAVASGGVYALCPPKLLFIPDKNGDDTPDGEPEVILDGFDFKNVGHNIANGLKWGPDGWLYGRHGILESSFIGRPGSPIDDRKRLNCGIFRLDPKTRAVEVFCEGGTNAWGMDWNAEGELFWTNTVIGHLWHGIRGAYYERMFGSHRNPHLYEYIKQTADHYHFDIGTEKWSDIRSKPMSTATDTLGGGHAHVGALIYEGGVWPEQYRGSLLTLNLHGRRINVDKIQREGCGYVARHDQDLLRASDPWFRGIDLSTGPDGNVFVLDWSDAGECHDNDGVHRSSGRIYKISYGEVPVVQPFDLSKMDESAQIQAIAAHPNNNWWPRMVSLVRQSPQVARVPDPNPKAAGLERLHRATSLQDLPLKERFPVAASLAAYAEDASDRQQPLMLWYGIEPAVTQFPDEAIALAVNSKIPKLRKFIARRLAEEIDSEPRPLDRLLGAVMHDVRMLGDVVLGMSEALKGVRQAPKPLHWDKLAPTLAQKYPDMIRELSLVFGSGRAFAEISALVRDVAADPASRARGLESLLGSPTLDQFELVKSLIGDRTLGTAARLGCARFGNFDVPALLLANWPKRQDWREANVTALSARPDWGMKLLAYAEANPEVRRDISPFHARQMRSLGSEALSQKLAKVWGEYRESPGDKKLEIARWIKLLTPASIAASDPERGRTVFNLSCGACHKLHGEGGAIGPDLTGADRHNLAYLLENIVDPSAVVPADYRLSVLNLKDGRTLTGVIPEQSERVLTLQAPTERIQILKSDIKEMTQIAQSLMPEGLLRAMSEADVRDLIAYLLR